jgi:beta-glucosidase
VGAAEVQGIQSRDVIAVVKHFIANSQETNRMTDSSYVSERTLEEIYAPQYETAVKQGGAGAVMCSLNRINSVYACENPSTLGILDDQFGFTGFVVSDRGGTHSTVASAKAGLDMEMNTAPGTYYGSALQTAVQDGQVPMATLDDMVLRILRLGHEQQRTTHVYLHADLELKQRTLDRLMAPSGHPGRYRAPDSIIAFLDDL